MNSEQLNYGDGDPSYIDPEQPNKGIDQIGFIQPALDQIDILRHTITDELLRVAGFGASGWQHWVARTLLKPPAQQFAQVAANFDNIVLHSGFQQAAKDLLSRFVRNLEIFGLENVPTRGSLLIVSNHPGTYDGLAIIASVPRDDLKVVISGIPFTHGLVASSRHFIYSPPPDETHGRMNTVRSIIRHLREDGSLLLFPTGLVDPDPAVLPGAYEALGQWSPSLELVLRKVPQAQVLPTIVSGVLNPASLRNPLIKLFKSVEVQKMAQFVQIVGQFVAPSKYTLVPHISFGQPLSVETLAGGGEGANTSTTPTLLPALIERTRALLFDHLGRVSPFSWPDYRGGYSF